MKDLTYEKHLTGLLVIDPYNDFISPGGKLWPRVREVVEATSCVSNMKAVLEAARRANLRIFFALHHRYRPGDYETWQYIAPIQRTAWEHKTFEDGTWGGEIHPDFLPHPGEMVAQEHWCSSGFANTDLDLLLKRHGVHKLVVIGLKANTWMPCRWLCKDQWGTSEERCMGGICWLDVLLTGIDFEESQRDRTALKL